MKYVKEFRALSIAEREEKQKQDEESDRLWKLRISPVVETEEEQRVNRLRQAQHHSREYKAGNLIADIGAKCSMVDRTNLVFECDGRLFSATGVKEESFIRIVTLEEVL